MKQDNETLNWGTYSSLNLLRQCNQRFNYRYLQKLERIEDPGSRVALNFGSWWHALRAAESITRGRKLGTLKWCPDKIRTVDDGPEFGTDSDTLVEDLMDGAQRWWDSLHEIVKDDWLDKINSTLPDRLNYLFEVWKIEYANEIVNEQPLAVEMKWVRPIPGFEGRVLLGYIDEIYHDTRKSMTVIRDVKTGKDLGSGGTLNDMMDSQLQFYAWGAAPTVAEWGYTIRATAYDRARSVHPKTPKLNQSGTLSKSITDFDATTYRTWAMAGQEYPGRKKDGSDAGVYEFEQAVYDNLITPVARSKWFQRSVKPLNKNVIKVHLQSAIDSMNDADRVVERVNSRGEAARNLTSACQYCEFLNFCRAQMVGGPQGSYDLSEFNLQEKPPKIEKPK